MNRQHNQNDNDEYAQHNASSNPLPVSSPVAILSHIDDSEDGGDDDDLETDNNALSQPGHSNLPDANVDVLDVGSSDVGSNAFPSSSDSKSSTDNDDDLADDSN